jgi:hypothetical protein
MRHLALRAAVTLATLAVSGGALADSQTPVSLSIRLGRVARVHRPLTVRVGVKADAGVLDTRTGPLRIEVKLASECGGVFRYTPGTTLLNRRLKPQPVTGRAYDASARGSARPRQAGTQTVCVWLVEDGDGRVFASDQSTTLRVRR